MSAGNTHTWEDFLHKLPPELHLTIRRYVVLLTANTATGHYHCNRSVYRTVSPLIPPLNGACPLMLLPCEARRHILHALLPSKEAVIKPGIVGNPNSRTCDLLVLNQRICSELSVILYEERTFSINIHEGLFSGGVEFLNSGLQRLQYQQSFANSHFKRFEGEKNPFGFERLKRIEFVIHPCMDVRSKATRHDPMLTYFTISAMLKLLKKNYTIELTYFKVRFTEATADIGTVDESQPVLRADSYWWNPTTSKPRETSIHGISNVELILRAFLIIDKAHAIEVELPEGVRYHNNTQVFVKHLINLLDPKCSQWEPLDEDLYHKLEVARDALDNYVFQLKFGKGKNHDTDIWVDLAQLLDYDEQEEPYPMNYSRDAIDSMTEDEQLNAAMNLSLQNTKSGSRTEHDGSGVELPPKRNVKYVRRILDDSADPFSWIEHEENQDFAALTINQPSSTSAKQPRLRSFSTTFSEVEGERPVPSRGWTRAHKQYKLFRPDNEDGSNSPEQDDNSCEDGFATARTTRRRILPLEIVLPALDLSRTATSNTQQRQQPDSHFTDRIPLSIVPAGGRVSTSSDMIRRQDELEWAQWASIPWLGIEAPPLPPLPSLPVAPGPADYDAPWASSTLGPRAPAWTSAEFRQRLWNRLVCCIQFGREHQHVPGDRGEWPWCRARAAEMSSDEEPDSEAKRTYSDDEELTKALLGDRARK